MFVPSQYLDLHDLISSPFGDLSRFVGIAVLVHCHEFIAVLVHCHEFIAVLVHCHEFIAVLVHCHELIAVLVHCHELIAVLVHCHELIAVLVHCHEMINTKILHCRNISKFYRKIVEKETKCIYLHINTRPSLLQTLQ